MYYTLSTDRDNRNQYITLFNSMTSDTINFKAGSEFYALTKTKLQAMAEAVNNYVQAQFDWELQINQQIDSATDVNTLQSIVIVQTVTDNTVNNLEAFNVDENGDPLFQPRKRPVVAS